jgi:putative peptidoglycan lipid II flippase
MPAEIEDGSEESSAPASPSESGGGGSRSAVVAVGIFASRIFGLVREVVTAHYFGTTAFSDVFRFALRAPNVLQNLLGEGTLSASFIPIYTRMLDEGRPRDAGRFAGAVFGLLAALAGLLSLLGVVFAEQVVTVFAAGFLTDDGGAGAVDRFPIAVTCTRITFPMTAVLVLHAWALGVLNSHRKFFLPYVAPVLWNIAMIATLVFVGSNLVDDLGPTGSAEALSAGALERLLIALCWGALVGGALQFLVQVPSVWKSLEGFRLSLSPKVPGVGRAVAAFGPVVAGRGVAQLGGYFDLFLAAFLVEGAIGALGFAQTLYVLPISLFAMSVAASELPELSSGRGPTPERIGRGLAQITFLTVPTVVGYLAFGFLIVTAIFRSGNFGLESTWLVYGILVVYSLGLPATNTSRLLQNVFFAMEDTKTPAKVAVQRVFLAAAVAIPTMWWLDRFTVTDLLGPLPDSQGLRWGAVGLALGSAVGAWYELFRLRHRLAHQVDGFRVPVGRGWKMAAVALASAAVAGAVWWLVPFGGAWAGRLAAVVVVGLFAVGYLVAAHLLGFPEIETWVGRFARRFKRG